MKKITLLLLSTLFFTLKTDAVSYLHNEYAYLQDVTFELYTEEVTAYRVPEQQKSIEETLMFEVLHAIWKDKHWVAYTLNKNLLGTFKVGQPALLDNGNTKKIFFVATFTGTIGGLDLYTAEYKNGVWSKPKNLGVAINTAKNESNPGLLNDNTLTYSSGGIIKKIDLKTDKVVDLEDATIREEKIIEQPQNTIEDKKEDIKENKNVVTQEIVKNDDKPTVQNNNNNNNNNTSVNSAVQTPNTTVQSLGTQSRDVMLAKFKTAIQLGAFSTPKWEQIYPLSKFGKLITYKNDKGVNVVWITGFSSHAVAENALIEVKSIVGFENAYITGK